MELSRPTSEDDSLHEQPAVDCTLARAEDDTPTVPSSRSGSTTLRDDLDTDVGPFQEPQRYRSAFGRLLAHLRHGKDLVCSERISVLLAFVPVGITIGFLEVGPILEFTLNALAIIPLAVVISSATENLAGRLGDTFGALLNVTVGNTAELMIFYVALSKNQIRIVQASLLGSVLVNSLLILGSALLFGGLRFKNAMRDRPAVRLSVALLDLGLLISIYPIAFWTATTKAEARIVKQNVLAISRGTSIGLILIYLIYLTIQMRSKPSDRQGSHGAEFGAIPLSTMSRSGAAQRQLSSNSRHSDDRARRTHLALKWPRWLPVVSQHHDRESDETLDAAGDASHSLLHRTTNTEDFENSWPSSRSTSAGSASRRVEERTTGREQISSQSNSRDSSPHSAHKIHRPKHSLSWKLPPSPPMTTTDEEQDPPRGRRLLSTEDAAKEARVGHSGDSATPGTASRNGVDPKLVRRNTFRDLYEHRRSRSRQSGTPLTVSIVVLVIAAIFASICSEFAVGAIPDIVESAKISQIFIGFVVLPVVGNAAEHVTAAKLAMHDKFVLAKSVAIESSTQVVLLITPAMILLGWAKNRELSLQFDIYEIASVVIASVVASFVVSCGKGDWKQGVLLYTIFVMIAIGAFLYPTLPKLYGREGT